MIKCNGILRTLTAMSFGLVSFVNAALLLALALRGSVAGTAPMVAGLTIALATPLNSAIPTFEFSVFVTLAAGSKGSPHSLMTTTSCRSATVASGSCSVTWARLRPGRKGFTGLSQLESASTNTVSSRASSTAKLSLEASLNELSRDTLGAEKTGFACSFSSYCFS